MPIFKALQKKDYYAQFNQGHQPLFIDIHIALRYRLRGDCILHPHTLWLGSRQHEFHHPRHHHAQHGPHHHDGRRPQFDETPPRHLPRCGRAIHHHATRRVHAHKNLWTRPVFSHRHRACRLLPGRRFKQRDEFLGQR